MSDVDETAAMRSELDSLRRRISRLERRLDSLEPETQPGVGREIAAPSSGGLLDALGEGLGALGFLKDE